MKFKFQHFIFFIFFTVISACTSDYIIIDDIDNPDEEAAKVDPFSFNIIIDDPSPRTRAINFDKNAAIRVNQIWMGVYDVETGERVVYNSKALGYQTVQSGQRKQLMFRMDLTPPQNFTPNEKGYVVVALANYSGVKDAYQDEMEDKLADADTWQKFNAIAVDVNSAYTDLHSNIAPVLAGFLYNYDDTYYDSDGYPNTDEVKTDETNIKKTVSTHVKIDQFEENKATSRGIMLSPKKAVENVIIKYDNTVNDGNVTGFGFSSKTLRLRRLVANINVNIQLTEEALNKLRLTDVYYKRYNMPKAVYIIEKRTTNCALNEDGTVKYPTSEKGERDIKAYDIELPESPEYSPNFADLDPSRWYYSDTDWQYGNVTGFSFQHFANKHWARNQVNDQKGRERCTKYGTDANGENLYYYHALVDENKKENDFNNYASFFKIKMHLIDNATGRALEAEYTIHEGYTSDELGDPIEGWLDENEIGKEYSNKDFKQYVRLKDYVVARNIDYYYNVFINGVDDIYYNVNTNGSDTDHKNGQGGKVWEFWYATDNKDILGNSFPNDEKDKRMREEGATCSYSYGSFADGTTVPPEGGYYKNAIYINNTKPDISFRLYGYNTETHKIEGYNYNFSQDAFAWLSGLWPPSAGASSRYFAGYDELIAFENDLPDDYKNGLTIIDPMKSGSTARMNIIDFVYYCYTSEESEFDGGKFFDIEVAPTNINEKEFDNRDVPWEDRDKYARAIYIADSKGQPDGVDGCTTLVNIFAGAQYPKLTAKPAVTKTPFPRPPLGTEIKIDNFAVIDENLKTFSIPLIPNLKTNGYKYIVTIDDVDYSNWVTNEGKPINGSYYYQIPMSVFGKSTGEIRLQVILTDGNVTNDKGEKYSDIYENLEVGKIGEVTLIYADWKSGGNPKDWDNALSFYKTAKFETYESQYLTFAATGTDTSKTFLGTGGTIQTGGGNDKIRFNIYNSCNISVTYKSNNSTERACNIKYGRKSCTGKKTGTSNVTVTYSIEFNDSDNLVEIEPNGGGVTFIEIKIDPYDKSKEKNQQ